MGGISIWHVLIVLVIVLVFFGPSRLPQLGKSMGEAIRGFKKGLDGDEIDVTNARRENLNPSESASTATTKTQDTKKDPLS